MKKSFDKKIIQDAISSELKKEVIAELSNKVFDAPARAVAGVSNMFSNIGGQMKLGAINKELERVATRIDKDWQAAEDVVGKLANKMSASKNPNVKQKAQAVQKNLSQVGSGLKNASAQLKNMSKLGADSAPGNGSSLDAKLGVQKVTDKYGFTSNQSAVDRWIENFGGDINQMSKPEQGKLQKMFMDLLSAGIDPFEVPRDKQEMLRQYHNYRMASIAETGVDPYPDYKHFEDVLGPEYANKMRANDAGLQANKAHNKLKDRIGPGPADQTRMADFEHSPNEEQDQEQQEDKPQEAPQQNKAAEFTKEMMANVSPQLKSQIQIVFEKAKKAGVKKEMLGKYLANLLPGPDDLSLSNEDVKFITKLNSQFNPEFLQQNAPQEQAPINSFGGGDFSDPETNPQPNWNAFDKLKAKPPASRKMKLPPISSGPAKKVLPPNQQTMSNFFGMDNAQVPSAIEKPPVQNFGNEIQIGSESNPAMMPKSLMMPQSLQKSAPKTKKKK